jgi:hypothetical protein
MIFWNKLKENSNLRNAKYDIRVTQIRDAQGPMIPS